MHGLDCPDWDGLSLLALQHQIWPRRGGLLQCHSGGRQYRLPYDPLFAYIPPHTQEQLAVQAAGKIFEGSPDGDTCLLINYVYFMWLSRRVFQSCF